MKNIRYSWVLGNNAIYNEEFLKACSSLYSNHYGIWSNNCKNNGRVKLTPTRIKAWLDNPASAIYYAESNDLLIGYAIAVQLNIPNYGVISWVTQLVVHSDYRKNGIAKNLLYTIWGLTNHYAWGVCSANPYAIRALEKATRRRSTPNRIKRNEKKLKKIGCENLPYIDEETVIVVNSNESKIDTKFYVSHDDVAAKMESVSSSEIPWLLGNLAEGEEWFAFTFQDQEQIKLEKIEIDTMLMASDDVAREAYSRMNLDSNKQLWLKHTDEEIEFISRFISLDSTTRVFDFGCGTGRHLCKMAEYGINGIGLDYVEKNINIANSLNKNKNIEFLNKDCRNFVLDNKADLILCLYDVIGSFADDNENKKIIGNIYRNLKIGGITFISVMNYDLTESIAKYKFSLDSDVNKLLDLKPSEIMKETGNIFNPDYYMVDTETHIIYRKEQFLDQKEIPKELIVRDRRFTLNEITKLCKEIGFEILETRYVNAANWDKSLDRYDKKAKEILLICKK